MDTFVKSEQIIVMENGNGSPCINLTSVPKETCTTLIEHKCDFIILEGMGRAIHTNLHAHFTVGKRSKYNLPRIQTQRKFRLQTRLWTWVAYKYFIFLKIDGFLREIPPRILLFWHLEVNLRRLIKRCEDCLKLAVLKNNWIASKLNGKLFDAVCKLNWLLFFTPVYLQSLFIMSLYHFWHNLPISLRFFLAWV